MLGLGCPSPGDFTFALHVAFDILAPFLPFPPFLPFLPFPGSFLSALRSTCAMPWLRLWWGRLCGQPRGRITLRAGGGAEREEDGGVGEERGRGRQEEAGRGTWCGDRAVAAGVAALGAGDAEGANEPSPLLPCATLCRRHGRITVGAEGGWGSGGARDTPDGGRDPRPRRRDASITRGARRAARGSAETLQPSTLTRALRGSESGVRVRAPPRRTPQSPGQGPHGTCGGGEWTRDAERLRGRPGWTAAPPTLVRLRVSSVVLRITPRRDWLAGVASPPGRGSPLGPFSSPPLFLYRSSAFLAPLPPGEGGYGSPGYRVDKGWQTLWQEVWQKVWQTVWQSLWTAVATVDNSVNVCVENLWTAVADAGGLGWTAVAECESPECALDQEESWCEVLARSPARRTDDCVGGECGSPLGTPLCTSPLRAEDWRTMVGGGGVGEVEVDGWEEGVDERLLTGMEVRKALRAAQLSEGQARVWDMDLLGTEGMPALQVPFEQGVSVTVLCGEGHFRVVLGVEETGEFYVFDSLGRTAPVVGHIWRQLRTLHPGSTMVELTLAPQGDAHSCGVWVIWAVRAFHRFMDSSHSDLRAFLVQDMATQGCTPTPSRGNQTRISTLKRAL